MFMNEVIKICLLQGNIVYANQNKTNQSNKNQYFRF